VRKVPRPHRGNLQAPAVPASAVAKTLVCRSRGRCRRWLHRRAAV